jgi:hypothetical protein
MEDSVVAALLLKCEHYDGPEPLKHFKLGQVYHLVGESERAIGSFGKAYRGMKTIRQRDPSPEFDYMFEEITRNYGEQSTNTLCT